MTDTTQPGETSAAIEAGVALADPTIVEPGKTYAFALPENGRVHIVNWDTDEFRARPRRKTGTYAAHTTDAFAAYLAKHALPETEIWADVTRSAVVAVINAHEGKETFNAGAGWGDHRVKLQLIKTDHWLAWTNHQGLRQQTDFAEHIEEFGPDIQTPDPATMLEIAQSIQATRGVDFESASRLSTGEATLVYREQTEAKAGQKGTLQIPTEFVVALQPYEGSPAYKVTARLRYRISDGGLLIGYQLDRPGDVLRNAFTDVIDDIREQTEREVLLGTPA